MASPEKCFFRVCYEFTVDRKLTVKQVMDIFEGVIPREKMFEYLNKWVESEFYDYGVSIDDGRFIPRNIPAEYFR